MIHGISLVPLGLMILVSCELIYLPFFGARFHFWDSTVFVAIAAIVVKSWASLSSIGLGKFAALLQNEVIYDIDYSRHYKYESRFAFAILKNIFPQNLITKAKLISQILKRWLKFNKLESSSIFGFFYWKEKILFSTLIFNQLVFWMNWGRWCILRESNQIIKKEMTHGIS